MTEAAPQGLHLSPFEELVACIAPHLGQRTIFHTRISGGARLKKVLGKISLKKMIDVNTFLLLSGGIFVIGLLSELISSKTGASDTMILLAIGIAVGPWLGLFEPAAAKANARIERKKQAAQ